MNQTYTVLSAAPILGAYDIDKSIEFYHDVLGFETFRKESGYAVIGNGTALIHFRYPAKELPQGANEIREIYIQVAGIEELWQKAKVYSNKYKMRELFKQSYGMTEFHVIDPNGILIFVGEVTE